MNKKDMKNKKMNSITKPCNTLLLFTVIYVLMVVISVIERVTTLKDLSTTDITFMTVLKEFWFPFIMIILLVIAIIAYTKKELYGVALEFSIALSMLVNVLVSVIIVGFEFGALLGTLVLPLILITHSIVVIIKIKKQKSA